MKKILITMVLIIMCISLFAQMTYTPYGSARVGYWLENLDEDRSGIEGGEFRSTYFLQTNSRLGVNFKQENFDARVEINGDNASGNIGLRLLWAKQRFGNWSLLVGQDEVVANQKANQVYGSNLELVGYGAVDGSRRMQVRMDMDNGLSLALIQPNMVNPTGAPTSPEFMFPMVNLGYNVKLDQLTLAPTFVFQKFDYNKDKNSGIEGSVTSFLASLTADFNATPELLLRLSGNYGSNTGNMGYGGPNPRATWNTVDNETNDVATMGGWLTARYAVSSTLNFTLGSGFSSSSNDDWNKDDTRMAVYLQSEIRLQRLRLIPEIGLLDEMIDRNDVKQGTLMYFGTQLRLDF